MSIPPLIIRADASTEVGTGHVMRMIALAQAWRRRGGEARFVSCHCPEGLKERVSESGFAQEMVDAVPGSPEDLEALLSHIGREEGVRVALDNYHFDFRYQSGVRQAAARLLVVDDYGHQDRYNADVLLNQNPPGERSDLDQRLKDGTVLRGTRFALLREEFLDSTVDGAEESERAGHVLVTLGGGDPDNVTARVMEALARHADCVSRLRVIIGGANPFLSRIEELGRSLPFPVEVIMNARNMSRHMGWADLVVSAAGSTCWELARMRRPAAVVVVAENQREIAAQLEREGAVCYLGWHQDLEAEDLSERLAPVLVDSSRREHLAQNLGRLVDGKGADRVAAALHGELRITIATAAGGWLRKRCDPFVGSLGERGHRVTVAFDSSSIPSGDVLLLLSFWGIVSAEVLSRNTHNVVVHESDLPKGRGWSPLTWQVLEGQNEIPIVLIEAEEEVDAGEIYLRQTIELFGGELIEEIRDQQAGRTFALCNEFIENYPAIVATGRRQEGSPTFYPRRGPADSRLDPERSLRDQFNLLRVVDNDEYPAFFEIDGRRYTLRISGSEQPAE